MRGSSGWKTLAWSIGLAAMVAGCAPEAELVAGNPVPPSALATLSFPSGLTIGEDETYTLDPSVDTVLEITGNLVVHGTLVARPDPGVQHTIRFVDVNESAFVGGGMAVLATDPGLWVVGSGRLDIAGEPRIGWNRTGTDPTWKSSDELRVAPTAVGDFGAGGFAPFTMGSPVPQVDPTLPKAEVMNLTRSVHIEGTPGGRAHVMIMSNQPQSILYAEFRYLGPTDVLGRYPLHFHHTGDGSRGSVLKGNVLRDVGNHALVTHASHGILVEDNVAYGVTHSAYWWDPIKGGAPENASDDVIYEHDLAADVTTKLNNAGAFELMSGKGNVIRNCAATGVRGPTHAFGYGWPPNEDDLWLFDNNVAHNISKNGIWVWQNIATGHVISNFIAYRNGAAGIDHGAYANGYAYDHAYLYENGTSGTPSSAGLVSHAMSPSSGSENQSFSCMTIAMSNPAIRIEKTNSISTRPVILDSVVFEDVPTVFSLSEGAAGSGQDEDFRFDIVNAGVACALPIVNPDPVGGGGGSPPPPSPPPAGAIVLTITTSSDRATKTISASLSWSGSTAAAVDIERDGGVLATVPNAPPYADSFGRSEGVHTYRVCEAGTTHCSAGVSAP